MKIFAEDDLISKKNDDEDSLKNIYVSRCLEDNIQFIKERFNHCSDIHYKPFQVDSNRPSIYIVFINGMCKKEFIDNQLLIPLSDIQLQKYPKEYITKNLIKNHIPSSKEVETFDKLIFSILSGQIVIFINGSTQALTVESDVTEGRAINAPTLEQSIRGPMEAFVEDIHTNIVMIRKKIVDPNLVVDILNVGKRTKTNIAVLYMKGIINERIPEEIKSNIGDLNIDGIIDSAQIEQLIEKHKWTVFPQMLATERPDRVVGSLLEGRAIILVNGTPFSLIVPTTLSLFFNAADDYFGRSIITTIIRFVRYWGFVQAISISSLFITLTAFHPGLLPSSLILSVIGTRGGVPFPLVIEILLMELTLYFIQEAAVRLPKVLGPTIGIVGGLVIGQAVVQAGIVSPIVVIIVALSAISSFTLPNYTFALCTIALRLFLIFCSSLLGLYGFVIGWLFILIHASTLESFGVKYLGDLSPYNKETFKDTLIRAPQSFIYKRPDYLDVENQVRQTTGNENNDA